MCTHASTLPDVVAQRNRYTCSDPGQRQIKQAIAAPNLNRIVVASCTPRSHEPTLPLPTATGLVAPIAVTPTLGAPTTTAAVLTPKLPNGQSVTVPVYKCDGVSANQYLDMSAATTQDLNDANRVQVKIGGAHSGIGKLAKMFVEVMIEKMGYHRRDR